jgi:hypothetical protein
VFRGQPEEEDEWGAIGCCALAEGEEIKTTTQQDTLWLYHLPPPSFKV